MSVALAICTLALAGGEPQPADGWRLFAHHCLACHSAGGAAPLRLDARGPIARKAATIATVLRERFMPPWLPTAGGPFAHDAVTNEERAAIAAWARAGADGAPDAPAAVAAAVDAPGIAAGWDIAADGSYMRTFADASTDRIAAAFARGPVAGFRMRRTSSAVERAMLSVDTDGALHRIDADDPGPGAHVRADRPGAPAGSLAVLGVDGAFLLPEGWVLRLPSPAGAAPVPGIAVELHAVGRGLSLPGEVGFDAIPATAPSPRLAEVFGVGPNGALRSSRTALRTETVSSPLVRDIDAGVIALRADTRCTSVRVVAMPPDGPERVLLEIARHREGLDRAYRFEPPVALPAGTVIRLETVHADDNALAKSQPMALLWCAPRAAADADAAARTPLGALQAVAAGADGITWFDAVLACNERSARDGLKPAYEIEALERTDGHVVRARVSRVAGNGWRLPRVTDIRAGSGPDGWWWTDEEDGLSGFRIVALRTANTDTLPPCARIPGLGAGIACPAVVPAGNTGHDELPRP